MSEHRGARSRIVAGMRRIGSIAVVPLCPPWRLPLLIVIALATLAAGVWFRSQATSEVADVGSFDPPLVSVYTTDASAAVRISITDATSFSPKREGVVPLKPDHPGHGDMRISLRLDNTSQDTRWAVVVPGKTSNTSPSVFRNAMVDQRIGVDGAATTVRVITGTSGELEQESHSDQRAATSEPGLVTIATLAVPAFESLDKAGYSAALPGVDAEQWSNSGHPDYFVGELRGLPIAAYVSAGQVLPQDQAVPEKVTEPGGQPLSLTPYFHTTRLTSSVILEQGRGFLEGAQVTSDVPSEGQIHGRDVVWQSDGVLGPVLQTANVAYLGEESTYDFYAGLAFGVAFSAALAAIQEIRRPQA